MKLQVLTGDLHDKYHQFLISNEKHLYYYSIKYMQFITELLNCKSEYWIVLQNEKITGVLPLMFKEGSFGVAVNSLPFYGSNGGILANDPESFSTLTGKYKEISESTSFCSCNLITHPLISQDYSGLKYDEVDERIGQFTSINYPGETCETDLMNSFHYKTRNMIRKAFKTVAEITIDNNSFDSLKDIHVENMRSIGGKPKSDDFFKLIPKHFEAGKDYNIYVAKNADGELMSALLLFYFNKTVEYFTPVIKNEFRDSQPLTALIFKSMTDACKAGYKYWNWGGTWKSQEGVYRFKSRWNTIDHPYYYFNKINNQKIYMSSAAELLAEYPDFYILPFNKLKSAAV